MNRLKDIFTFSEEFPLIFTQANFWIFFAVIYFVFALIYKKIPLRNAYLFLVSLFFYYKTSGLFIGILIFSTLVDFFIGRNIYRSNNALKRKVLVTTSVCVNLLVLCYFKYAYFFTDSFNYLFHTNIEVFNWLAHWGNGFANQTYFTVDKIILPVGISFYTFQTISYSVDIYRGNLKPLKSIMDFGFFVSFFPQLVAGPIVRAESFVPQINKPTSISVSDFNNGTFMILKGLVKKMLFADFIAMHFLDRVFDAPEMFSGFANVMAMIGYSLQIYGDFSGYTDIAIGLALLMGFELPKNFNSPYKAVSTADFWRRWHISLSTWLRDYLYIPLGGNRKGSTASYIILAIILLGVMIGFGNNYIYLIIPGIVILGVIGSYFSPTIEKNINTNINLMLTMLIGGLWHGASWKFVIWGGLNGLGLVVYKFWRKASPYENSTHWFVHFWKVLVTFIFITFTRIYFRSESMGHIRRWYHQVANNMDWAHAWDILVHYQMVFWVMLAGYITHWLPQSTKETLEQWYAKSPMPLKIGYATVVGVMCYQAFSTDFQPFIYFQF
ncbi:D-alanyl-lipoteichoic acid acyltransferase DltB, MBOAT superfamily [Pustulibacterium marinum]|uniref:D-alanyl-lipoteichoic acid acyltransferase DltB, MBOAT superfamily n=1 Tax=Pustulibacterium marinum TaxID=1224947 RepID=A0A1I7GRQ0_9FLAO|nr:MBOAT family O-acyltransferase [Pustulibacterium marinum]SFU51110.1 D-alanyl-lipoteichoic acid acyltransferase DltB, MBOAT superfamily [Pustulibacterium marinum]